MQKIESLLREFLSLTAGRANPEQHNNLWKTVLNKNYVITPQRVRHVIDSVESIRDVFSEEEIRKIFELEELIKTEWKNMQE